MKHKKVKVVRAWAIVSKRPYGIPKQHGYMIDLHHKRIKRTWDGWFARDGRWIFTEVLITHIGKSLKGGKVKP